MAAQPFQYQFPGDQTEVPPTAAPNNAATYVYLPTDTLTLAHAVRELQNRINAFNAANPTNPI